MKPYNNNKLIGGSSSNSSSWIRALMQASSMFRALEAIELSICSIFKITVRELRLGREIVMNAVCSFAKGILGESIKFYL